MKTLALCHWPTLGIRVEMWAVPCSISCSVLAKGMKVGLAECPVSHSRRTHTCSASFCTHSTEQAVPEVPREFWPKPLLSPSKWAEWIRRKEVEKNSGSCWFHQADNYSLWTHMDWAFASLHICTHTHTYNCWPLRNTWSLNLNKQQDNFLKTTEF